jgi:hypothetical protein
LRPVDPRLYLFRLVGLRRAVMTTLASAPGATSRQRGLTKPRVFYVVSPRYIVTSGRSSAIRRAEFEHRAGLERVGYAPEPVI